jgi:capsular exopolysaccharide synthesis family protein
MFNIVLSIVFGLAGGIGLAFLADYFDNSIKDTDDIEKKIDLPTLGVIPIIESPKEPSGAKVIPLRREPQTHLPVVIAGRNANPVIEAFRSIGAFILLSTAAKPPKAILVTGPGERAGKTSICINIAKALIESLGRGIIIDGDLRKPKLHAAFELENAIGLSSFLSGNVDFDATDGRLVKPCEIAGLSVMTAGPVPPNPSELLGSSRMQDLIYALQPLYDFIIIDSPPVMGLPDAIYLSKIVDGTVFVVKAGVTPLKALKETKKVFRDINAKILGVVLNGVKRADLKYGTYNYYHSAYYSSYFNEQQK